MSEAEAVPAGGRVVGRYVLYDEIAAGGMATVHIGRLVGAVGFSRSVAIKRLHAQFARDPEFVNMFLEEARLTSRVRHPNVVPVLDVESTGNELFLVMEFIQGETLSRLTRVDKQRSRIVPMPIALAIAADLLNGLHAAHEAHDENGNPMQIVHRDISPHNVMVGSDGIGRVLDFGIAKASSSAQSTREGEVKGKFAYMSPEQLSSVPVDRRADIFAATIVLWEMLTGRRLFSANDPAGIVGKVLSSRIQPPSERIGGLPPALDALVMRGLERNRYQRFATAAEMARAIESVGVPLASRSEVATWVKRIAGDTLKRRAKRLAQIERTGSSAAMGTVPLSGPSLPAEGTATGSESGFRPIRGGESADSSQSMLPFDDEPRKPSRAAAVVVAMLAALLGASGFFVWRAGGVQPARAKVSHWMEGITNPSWKVTQTAKAAAAASASAGAETEAASQAAAAASGEDGLSFESTPDGKPTAKPRGARPGVHVHAMHPDSTLDPKVTTNVPTGAAGHGGNLGEAIASAAGGNGSVGQDAPDDKPKPASGSIPQRPSPGGVQVAVGGAMGAVRADGLASCIAR